MGDIFVDKNEITLMYAMFCLALECTVHTINKHPTFTSHFLETALKLQLHEASSLVP